MFSIVYTILQHPIPRWQFPNPYPTSMCKSYFIFVLWPIYQTWRNYRDPFEVAISRLHVNRIPYSFPCRVRVKFCFVLFEWNQIGDVSQMPPITSLVGPIQHFYWGWHAPTTFESLDGYIWYDVVGVTWSMLLNIRDFSSYRKPSLPTYTLNCVPPFAGKEIVIQCEGLWYPSLSAAHLRRSFHWPHPSSRIAIAYGHTIQLKFGFHCHLTRRLSIISQIY